MKIILMMAMTADGKIAKNSDHFPDWTSKEDKRIFSKITKEHGVVIMGEKTFRTFPKPLPGRLNVVFTLEKNLPETENVKWVSGELEKVLEELEKAGHESAVLGGGTNLNTQFLKKGLISEIYLTVEPKIFGDGMGVFGGDFDLDLKFLGYEMINESAILLKYEVLG